MKFQYDKNTETLWFDLDGPDLTAADIARDRAEYDKTIFLDYCWMDEDGAPITKTEREYFEDENALYRRREELENEYATIIRFQPPKKPETSPSTTPAAVEISVAIKIMTASFSSSEG